MPSRPRASRASTVSPYLHLTATTRAANQRRFLLGFLQTRTVDGRSHTPAEVHQDWNQAVRDVEELMHAVLKGRYQGVRPNPDLAEQVGQISD